jgi:glycine betaine transporter
MGTFTGIFIARISKGRTIKEFFNNYNCYSNISYCYLVFSLCESAFDIVANGDQAQFNNVFTSLFVFLEYFPLHSLTLLGILVLISIINSVDSAIFVLGMISDKGNENPKRNIS